MSLRANALDARLAALDAAVEALRPRAPAVTRAIERVRTDLAAIRFHLMRGDDPPVLLAILGGTGTGKSTLVNRLLDANVTATSFRRTFTAGAVAIASKEMALPARWLGLDHARIGTEDLPARGEPESLAVVTHAHALTQRVALIDTPDLDGDQPAHHAQADRVFRWADAVLFLVTPEKYQMTELLPYYRLAHRYATPALFVMNKVEEQVVVDDYVKQVGYRAFALPRDGSAYEPPREAGVDALREAIATIDLPPREQRLAGVTNRTGDLLDRARDQVLAPLREARREVNQLVAALRAMETPSPGVDVNPLTQALQRRLQQRSVLYLMGPGRMLDRVRQLPGLLARLPRTAWDLLRAGQVGRRGADDMPPDLVQGKLDFRAALVDQFVIVQSRIDDVIRASKALAPRMAEDYADAKLDPERAGAIGDEEVASLQSWLENRWNATPRDTAVIEKLIKYLPGGQKLTKWSEAAPYILAIVVATHHAFFGPVDLLVIGGWSLATWLTEKLSNEVAARARAANSAIASRFAKLAHEQIQRTIAWLEQQAPPARELDALNRLMDEISEMVLVPVHQ